jgi:hypothetical protein
MRKLDELDKILESLIFDRLYYSKRGWMNGLTHGLINNIDNKTKCRHLKN